MVIVWGNTSTGSRVRQTAIILIALLLGSCGGSGGSNTTESDDSTAPLLILRSVTGNSITTNQTVLPVIGTTSPTAGVTVNGVPVSVDGTGNFVTSVNLATGSNTITVVATLDSLQTSIQFNAILQQTPPALVLSSPAATLVTNNSSLVVTGNTDPSGVDLSVNGVPQTLSAGNFSTSISLSSGANLIRVVATDSAGNETVIDRTVILDQSQPLLAITGPQNGSTTYVEPLVVEGMTEPGATVTVNGASATLTPNTEGLLTFSKALTAFETPTNVTIVATDPAGNATTVNLTINRAGAPGTLYVANTHPNATDSASCGAHVTPCLTISQGLGRAESSGAPQVLVASGIYPEEVSLVNGISLLGGFDENFSIRNTGSLKAEIWGAGSRTVSAASITTPTVLEGFLIRGGVVSTPSANSTALHIVDSDSALQVRNNIIVAGAAAAGQDGASGTDGIDGVNGGDGVAGGETLAFICASSDFQSGGGAGVRTVNLDNISGGAGGSNVSCPSGSGLEVSGQDGASGLAGAGFNGGGPGSGGDAGDDGEINSLGQCLLPVQPMDGGNGGEGGAGLNANPGAGGSITGTISASEWIGAAGTAGQTGGNGGGGGGGGAGGGAISQDQTISNDRLGSTGGGGGSGAGGGTGGGGGGAGGASFGIFMTFTTTPITLPLLINNEITLGIAGPGGRGGDGGVGGVGGIGGAGGGVTGGPSFCYGTGGDGGRGGDGGHGGGGGGGAGGISAGLYLDLKGFSGSHTYDLDNSINTTTGMGGTGGQRGLSLGNSGSPGTAGSVTDIVVN